MSLNVSNGMEKENIGPRALWHSTRRFARNRALHLVAPSSICVFVWMSDNNKIAYTQLSTESLTEL